MPKITQNSMTSVVLPKSGKVTVSFNQLGIVIGRKYNKYKLKTTLEWSYLDDQIKQMMDSKK